MRRTPLPFVLAAAIALWSLYLAADLPAWASFPLFIGLGLATALAIVVGVRRHRPRPAWPWTAFAVAALLVAAANALLWSEQALGTASFPTPGQLVYLATYPVMTAGVVSLIRARSPGRDVVSMVDALLLTGVAGVFGWVLVWRPGFDALDGAGPVQLTALVYPLLDLTLLTVTLRLAVGAGRRPPAFWYALGALVMLLSGDIVFSLATIAGEYAADHPLVAAYGTSLVLISGMALHPSMAVLGAPAGDSSGVYSHRRLALLVAAGLLVPLLQATDDLHGMALEPRLAGWVITLLVGLVALRMGLLLGALRRSAETIAGLQQRRAEARLGALIQHSTDAVLVVDEAHVVRYASPALRSIVGLEPDALVGHGLAGLVSADEADALAANLERLMRGTGDRVMTFEHRTTHVDGTARHLELVGVNRLATPEVAGVVLTVRDLTDRKRFEDQLRTQALTDPLTGLANRTLFRDRVGHALARRRRDPRGGVAVVFLDLDDFKTVNDGLGHAAGDELLQAVSGRLVQCVRPEDTVARLGGDEFAALLEGLAQPTDATAVVDRMLAALDDHVAVGDQLVRPAASIGVAFADGDADPEALLRNADTAMYTAKAAGKGRAEAFSPGMHDQAVRRLEVKGAMESALDEGRFRLVYQPVVDLHSGGAVGVEGLLRWRDPVHGDIGPGEFVPLAEETGSIIGLGRWVLRRACEQAAHWQQGLPTPVTVSVNVSARQVIDGDIVADVMDALASSGLPAGLLALELTESLFISDRGAVAATLAELRRLGISIAVDDFGTGFSSLSYLRDFPIDVLKIDRSFVNAFDVDDPQHDFAAGVLALARHLRLQTVAEGIEQAGQLIGLRSLGCHLGQGYLFSRPVEADDVPAVLAGLARTAPRDAGRRLSVPSAAVHRVDR